MRLVLLFLFILPLSSHAQNNVHLSILSDVQNIYSSSPVNLHNEIEFSLGHFDGSEVASADRNENHYTVSISRNLLKNPGLMADGLRIIACHELGHLFGGAPRRNVPFEWTGPTAVDGLSNLSSEGQADFYASATCFRTVVAGQDHKQFIKNIKVDPATIALCDSTWGKDSQRSALCQRTISGAENFLNLYGHFNISVSTPDKTNANELIRDQYPARQCRLDTFVRGALCKSRKNLSYDFNNSEKNDCEFPEGKRPACWFK